MSRAAKLVFVPIFLLQVGFKALQIGALAAHGHAVGTAYSLRYYYP